MTDRLPTEVVEAAVTVCGRAFYLKAPLKTLMLAKGVPAPLWDRYDVPGNTKYSIARNVFADLDSRGADGRQVLRAVIAELANMSKPHPSVEDKAAGQQALRELREVATAQRVLTDPETARRHDRDKRVADAAAARHRRGATLAALARRVADLSKSANNAQARGYELERILAELFGAFEMTYRPSYRRDREQVDGAFDHRGFHYLVEARWRAHPPDFGDLADFKGKIDGKLDSTRGMFVSMAGFDEEVVSYFMNRAGGTRNNLILFDGQDLMAVLEQSIDFAEALDYKIAKAAQEGAWWAPLRESFA